MRRRNLFFAGALLFYIWESIVAFHWVRQFDSIGVAVSHLWHAATEDAMLLLIMQDAGIFGALVIGWLVLDMRRRALGAGQCFGWLLLIVLVGSPGVLVYLGRHCCDPMNSAPDDALRPTQG